MKGPVSIWTACLMAVLLAVSLMHSVRSADIELGGGARAGTSVRGGEKKKDDAETPEAPGSPEEGGISGRSADVDLVDGPVEIAPADLPLCEGNAKFKCCDDKDFSEKDGTTFCSCSGAGNEDGCSYKVDKSSNPLVVTDLRADSIGEACRCKDPKATNKECFGRTKISCCDDIKPGATKCRCLRGDQRCMFKKGKNGEWINNRFESQNCVCP